MKIPYRAAGLFAAAFLIAQTAFAQTVEGSWTVRQAEEPDRVQLSFAYGHHSQSSDDWRAASLPGLDLAPSARHDVHFTLEREAGRIEAEGAGASGTAAGSFRFTANSAYPAELRKLGLGAVDPETQMSFALHDVNLAFIRDMMALKPTGLEAGELVALAIHGATRDWAAGLIKLGYGNGAVNAGQLIAFRIQGVTPDYISSIEAAGFPHPKPEQLIAMRIHGVTPDYVASLRAKGVKELSLDQLMTMKILGID